MAKWLLRLGSPRFILGSSLDHGKGPCDACRLLTVAEWQEGVVCLGCRGVGFAHCGRSIAVPAFGSCLCCGALAQCCGLRGTAMSCLVPCLCPPAALWTPEYSCLCPSLQGRVTAQVNLLQVRRGFGVGCFSHAYVLTD